VRKLLLLSAVLVLGLTAPAAAGEPSGPVVATEFADSFPALLPVEETTTRTHPTPSGALGPDERVLAVASFWLLLAALATWRVARRRPERDDPTPVTGWVLGYAPPLPR
jgi:hypothetical protein